MFYSVAPAPRRAVVAVEKSPVSRLLALRTRVLRDLTPELRGAFLKAIAETLDQMTLKEVAAAIEENDIEAAAAAIPWGEVGELMLRGAVPKILRSGLEESGRLSVNALLSDLELPPAAFTHDVLTEASVEWVREASGLLIDGIKDTQLAALRVTLEAAVREGTSPLDTARLIRDGGMIGLTERDARAVANYRARLERDGTRNDAIAELSARQSRRHLNARAEAIARTELIQATNEGRREVWRQALDQGLVDDATVRRWVTVQPCEICAPMEGETAPIDGEYVGSLVPGEVHPRCECSEVLEIVAAA